jgi:hypothetical protein
MDAPSVEIPMDRIHPNLRVACPEEAVAGLCRLLREGADLEPIQVWFDGWRFRILDGEMHWRALKRLGRSRARVVISPPHGGSRS